jgi:uncharacterized protein
VPDLAVVVVPRASADRVGPFRDGVLRVRTTRPPADGEANRAVERLIADALGVPPSSVLVVAGQRARRKRMRIEGIDAGELGRRLAALGCD